MAIAFSRYLKTFPDGIRRILTSHIDATTLIDLDRLSLSTPNQSSAEPISDELQDRVMKAFQRQQSFYYKLRSIRKNLYKLAQIAEHPEPYLGQVLNDVVLDVMFADHAILDKDGILRRAQSHFAEAIDGVEVARIRACLICRKLFWASRSDKVCCSEEHSRIIRQKRIREKHKVNKDIYASSAKKRKISRT